MSVSFSAKYNPSQMCPLDDTPNIYIYWVGWYSANDHIYGKGNPRYGQKGLSRNSRKTPSWGSGKRRLGNPCQINVGFHVCARVGVQCRLQHDSELARAQYATTKLDEIRTMARLCSLTKPATGAGGKSVGAKKC